MQRGRSPLSLRDLLAADLLRPGQQLSFRQRPSTTAELTAEGKLRIGHDEYSSPSTAARAVTGGAATNGWLAWSIEQDGRVATLADLRGQLLSR